MPSETEVVSCPACNHLLRVPLDWLGQSVQCPECKALFRAPIKDGDGFTAPVLISRPAAATPGPHKPRDPMLLLPAFGLLFCGVVGLAVNGVTAVRYVRDPDAAKQDVLRLIEESRKRGIFSEGPEQPDARAQFDGDLAEQRSGTIRVLIPAFAVVSGFVFYGGIAMAARRHYRMAQLGCVLAAVNLANGCCIPGAVAGLWGLLMLNSEEGRAHFNR